MNLVRTHCPKREPWRGISTLRAFGGLASVLLGCAFAGLAHAQTLSKTLVEAYLHNPKLESERAALRAADEQVALAMSNWRPTISASAERRAYGEQRVSGGTAYQNSIYSGRLPQLSYGLSLDQPIFQGGQEFAKLSRAENKVYAARAQLVATEQIVLLQVVGDYLDVLRDREIFAIESESMTALEKVAEATRTRFAAGEVNRVDVAQAGAALERARVQVYSAESALRTSEVAFERDVGISPSSLEYPENGPQLPAAREAMEAAAQAHNPDILIALFTARSDDDAIDEIRRAALPSLDVTAAYDTATGSLFRGSLIAERSVLLRVTWPIYQAGTVEAQSRAAVHTAAADDITLIDTRKKVSASIASTLFQLQEQKRSLGIGADIVRDNDATYNGTLALERAGERSLFEVVSTEQTLLQSRVEQARTKREVFYLQYVLKSLMGELTAQGLKLPVNIYDATAHYDSVKNSWFGFDSEEDAVTVSNTRAADDGQ